MRQCSACPSIWGTQCRSGRDLLLPGSCRAPRDRHTPEIGPACKRCIPSLRLTNTFSVQSLKVSLFGVISTLLYGGALTIVPVRNHATVRGGVAAHNHLCFDYVARILALGTLAIRGSAALVAMQSCCVFEISPFLLLTKYNILYLKSPRIPKPLGKWWRP